MLEQSHDIRKVVSTQGAVCNLSPLGPRGVGSPRFLAVQKNPFALVTSSSPRPKKPHQDTSLEADATQIQSMVCEVFRRVSLLWSSPYRPGHPVDRSVIGRKRTTLTVALPAVIHSRGGFSWIDIAAECLKTPNALTCGHLGQNCNDQTRQQETPKKKKAIMPP